jgi:F5/8 type C domain
MLIKDVGRLTWVSALALSLTNGCATEFQDTSERQATLEGDAGSAGSAGSETGGTDSSSGAAGTAAALAGTGGVPENGEAAGSAGGPAIGGSSGSGGSGGASGAGGVGGGGAGGAGGKNAGGTGGSAGAGGKGGMGGMAGAGGGPTQVACKKVKLAIKGATASSTENDTFPVSYAWDGDAGTRWASAQSEPQWIYFDLGEVAHVSRAQITWETAFATAYRIEIAQAAAGPWTSMFEETNGDGATDDVTTLTAKNGRYVRLYLTTRSTIYGFSLWEVAIYGDLDETCK